MATPAERRWAEQWLAAGKALAEQRRLDLQRMTDAEALAAAENLLSLTNTVALSPSRRTWSGLVEQQAMLQRLRRS